MCIICKLFKKKKINYWKFYTVIFIHNSLRDKENKNTIIFRNFIIIPKKIDVFKKKKS